MLVPVAAQALAAALAAALALPEVHIAPRMTWRMPQRQPMHAPVQLQVVRMACGQARPTACILCFLARSLGPVKRPGVLSDSWIHVSADNKGERSHRQLLWLPQEQPSLLGSL